FVTVNEPGGFVTSCLPPPPNVGPYDKTVFGLWEDMRTDLGLSGCAGFPGGTCGIFTSTSGTTPNRIFNIEWRTVLFNNNGSAENFEVRLYENPALSQRFDVIYGTIITTGADHLYVGGVQGTSSSFTQDFCGTTPPQNVSRAYTFQSCATPTPAPTPCNTGSYRVLIVEADCGIAPITLRNNLLALPGITVVDIYDAYL